MKTIIICLLIILVGSGYMAITQEKRVLKEVGKVEIVNQQTNQTNDYYIVEITEEDDE